VPHAEREHLPLTAAGSAWSSEESAAYEAATEAINGAVGACTARIATEEARPVPDLAVIDAARAGRAECARRREELDPADGGAVAETRRRFALLASEIRRSTGE